MADLFHFDVGGLITFVFGIAVSALLYYVRSSVQLSTASAADEAHAKIAEAETRLESLAAKLIERIDAVKEAVVAVNVTLARADERIAQSTRDINRLDERMKALENRCKACETVLIRPNRSEAAA